MSNAKRVPTFQEHDSSFGPSLERSGAAREWGREYGGKREKLAPPPPRDLIAKTFQAGGDDFVVFSWGGERAPDSDVVPTVTPTTIPTRTATGLSLAEQGVLDLVVLGSSNREIATRRGVSERTIANQVASILRKVGARSRFELIRRYPAT